MSFTAARFPALAFLLVACTANAADSQAPETHYYLIGTECSLNGQGCKNVFYLLPDEYVNRDMASSLKAVNADPIAKEYSVTANPSDVRSVACGVAAAAIKNGFNAPTVQADGTVWQLDDVNCMASAQVPLGAVPLPASMLGFLEQPGPYAQQNGAAQ